MNRHDAPVRTAPYELENRQSARVKGDRVHNRPRSVHALLNWAVRGYELDVPAGSRTSKMHESRRIEEDGDPALTPQARAYFGFNQGIDETTTDVTARPNDWRAVACSVDADGFYRTPMRCAIARIGDAERRAFVGALACNLYTPVDVSRAFGVPDWAAAEVIERSLNILWSAYSERPYTTRSRGGKSESQLDAEAERKAA